MRPRLPVLSFRTFTDPSLFYSFFYPSYERWTLEQFQTSLTLMVFSSPSPWLSYSPQFTTLQHGLPPARIVSLTKLNMEWLEQRWLLDTLIAV